MWVNAWNAYSIMYFQDFGTILIKTKSNTDKIHAPDATCSSQKCSPSLPPTSASFSLPETGSMTTEELAAELERLQRRLQEHRECIMTFNTTQRHDCTCVYVYVQVRGTTASWRSKWKTSWRRWRKRRSATNRSRASNPWKLQVTSHQKENSPMMKLFSPILVM